MSEKNGAGIFVLAKVSPSFSTLPVLTRRFPRLSLYPYNQISFEFDCELGQSHLPKKQKQKPKKQNEQKIIKGKSTPTRRQTKTKT